MLSKPRVVIADAQALVAEAFEKLLAGDCIISGRVTDGRSLVEMVRAQKPDIAIVDVGLPLLNGLDASVEARQAHPHLKVVIVTTEENPDVAASALRGGASAYLLKRCAGSEVLKAIHEVMRGRTYVTPLIANFVVESMAHAAQRRDASPRLTLRQREVLQLLAEGRSMKEAARILHIGVGTVAFHKYRLMEQLHARSKADLIRFAVQRRVI
jgi:DNA-binding NarL/FixJ family response regulator